jgi:hypothetical protein
MRICRIPGCGKQTDGYSVYCSQHRRRQRRHGSAQQVTISVTRLKPHRDAIKRWLDSRPEENGWGPLRTLFRHLVEHAQTELELARTGASPRYLRQAHEDVLKVAGEGPAVVDQVILTVAAMYRLQAVDRLAFVSDDGFRVQLARRFRAHTDLNVAVTWSEADGRNKRVYRDASSRHLVVLGQLLAKALGGLSLAVIEAMDQEDRREAEERRQAFAAVMDSPPPQSTPASPGRASGGLLAPGENDDTASR